MEHFVTLFDSMFLPQGLALHMSMERHAKNYMLWVLCVDDAVHKTLDECALPNVRLLKLSELETPELLQVKLGRTKGEYCWTLTPYAPRFVFDADRSIRRVTYLDADMWFRKDPAPIFAEFEGSGKQVLITDHNYAPEYDQSATSGQYCVQFITFTREGGEPVRKWWEERCIEWCYHRFEDGKFGDQKYLDDWPLRFAEHVHVLQNKELLLAPWNATRFPYGRAVCFHFHGLRIVSSRWVSVGVYKLPRPLIENVYLPYLIDLRRAVKMAERFGWKMLAQSSMNILNIPYIMASYVYRSIASLPRGVMSWR